MSTPILATKLYIPPPRPNVVFRSRLIEQLSEGLHHTPGVTLISAPAGFGKTTLVSSWIYGLRIDDLQAKAVSQNKIVNPIGGTQAKPKIENRVAWLSLDEGDNDPTRFLTYLIAALQKIAVNVGEEALAVLHASQPQPPPTETI